MGLNKKSPPLGELNKKLGSRGLEPLETLVEGFTVPCNCRYANSPFKAACRIWTHDPEITNHVLYQLS